MMRKVIEAMARADKFRTIPESVPKGYVIMSHDQGSSTEILAIFKSEKDFDIYRLDVCDILNVKEEETIESIV